MGTLCSHRFGSREEKQQTNNLYCFYRNVIVFFEENQDQTKDLGHVLVSSRHKGRRKGQRGTSVVIEKPFDNIKSVRELVW